MRPNPDWISGDDHVALVGGHVVEGYSIRLAPASAHCPDLITVFLVEEMLIVPRVWHPGRRVSILPWELNELAERVIPKVLGEVSPAIDLVVEVGVQGGPVVFEIFFHCFDALFYFR